MAATATRLRFLLAGDLVQRPADDPRADLVIYMCLYACDVLNGHVAGPYQRSGRAPTRARA